MKIVKIEIILDKGDTSNDPLFKEIIKEIRKAIKSVVWGESDRFVINPTIKGNGVNPIKHSFVDSLKDSGWQPEVRMSLVKGMDPGPIDAIKETEAGFFAVEWETGNISSSHRALNKIAVALIQEQIFGGILIMPVRNLSKYLTDRIGNYEELRPYFALYQNLNIKKGIIGVISVDYDDISKDVDLIKKGKDGNSKKRRKKKK